jgi:hypothetical protein
MLIYSWKMNISRISSLELNNLIIPKKNKMNLRF